MTTTDNHLFWARRQMDEARTPIGVRVVVEKLLATFSEGVVGQTQGEEIIAIFNKLAAGHALTPPPFEEGGKWVDARPGNIVIRDVMRVKADAYGGPAGIAHNGRVGVVVAVRHGDIHIKYTDDRQPKPLSVAHSPFVLEKHVPQ